MDSPQAANFSNPTFSINLAKRTLLTIHGQYLYYICNTAISTRIKTLNMIGMIINSVTKDCPHLNSQPSIIINLNIQLLNSRIFKVVLPQLFSCEKQQENIFLNQIFCTEDTNDTWSDGKQKNSNLSKYVTCEYYILLKKKCICCN